MNNRVCGHTPRRMAQTAVATTVDRANLTRHRRRLPRRRWGWGRRHTEVDVGEDRRLSRRSRLIAALPLVPGALRDPVSERNRASASRVFDLTVLTEQSSSRSVGLGSVFEEAQDQHSPVARRQQAQSARDMHPFVGRVPYVMSVCRSLTIAGPVWRRRQRQASIERV